MKKRRSTTKDVNTAASPARTALGNAMITWLLLVCIGAALAAANFWFIRRVYYLFYPPEPNRIDAFQIISADKTIGVNQGSNLAGLLHARLAKLQQDLNPERLEGGTTQIASTATQRTRSALAREGTIGPTESPANVPAWPLQFDYHEFKALDLKMSVAGTEVGGLLTWAQRALAEDRLIRVTSSYRGSGAVVAVDVPGQQPLWLEIVSKTGETRSVDELVVDEVACGLAKRRLETTDALFRDMSTAEFRTLVEVLLEAKELNRRQRLGQSAAEAYALLLPKLQQLMLLTPQWTPLLQLAAQVAVKASAWNVAAKLLTQQLAQLKEGDPRREEIQKSLNEVNEKLREQQLVTSAPPTTRTTTARAERPQDRIRRQLGIPLGGSPGRFSVTVVGTPPHWLDARAAAAPPSPGAQQSAGSEALQEYVATLVSAVRLVAPNAKFEFQPLGEEGLSEFGLVKAFRGAIERRPAPEVILFCYGPLQGPLWEEMFIDAARAGILVVTPAGNDPAKPIPLPQGLALKAAMIVAATTENATRAPFTQASPECFWAPGVGVPVEVAPGSFQLRDGTGYAAALAAGVAGSVRNADTTHRSVEQLLDLLRKSSKPFETGDAPILNFEAALRVIQSGG